MYTDRDFKQKIKYVAPLISNGSLSLQIDYEGTQCDARRDGEIKENPTMRIWWEGRRYAHMLTRELISFGKIEQKIKQKGEILEVLNYKQELDEKNALMNSECGYSDEIRMKTQAFVHNDYNVIAISKTFETDNILDYEFKYRICSKKCIDEIPEFMTYEIVEKDGKSISINYNVKGQFDYRGRIIILADENSEISVENNVFCFKSTINGSKKLNYYIIFCDNVDFEDYEIQAKSIRSFIISEKYDGIRKTHTDKWNEYFNEGYASVGDAEVEKIYNTAQYHLKCDTTKWSLPVGINDTCWNGRYFAYDEYFMFSGHITSNHLEYAKNVPEFRFSGLNNAMERVSWDRCAARYPWETVETCEEAAPPGFWCDHIFHMANISESACDYYRFSANVEFLEKKAYPIIIACSEFYLKHTVYRNVNGKTIVGYCTDFERLGAAVSNAYQTTCAVIKTFTILNKASEILGITSDIADECKELALELKAGLPKDSEKYLPYPGCKQKSIAVYAGSFPYSVIDRDDILQKNAIDDYEKYEQEFGNMYAVGNGICSWYSSWQAIVYARLGDSKKACKGIRGAMEMCGSFGEMYEIKDLKTNTIFRPWFTTAAGVFVHAINEMLLQSDENGIHIAPALGAEKETFSFKLAAEGGFAVEAAAEENRMKKLRIIKGKYCVKSTVTAIIPKYIDVSGILSDKVGLKQSTRTNYKYMYNKYVSEKLGLKKISVIKYTDILKFYNSLITDLGFKPNSVEIIHT
ncbi:MAG: hypothetical protein MRZ29_05605, partial [Oscillospiraceae bacterium]|nr:hypothetical protein [Oscillospiraceae bacterium]